MDTALCTGPGDQVVQYEVEVLSRRDPVRGSVTKECWAEVVVGNCPYLLFDESLRNIVRRGRLRRGGLIHQVDACIPIDTAGRREKEALYSGSFRQLSESNRS